MSRFQLLSLTGANSTTTDLMDAEVNGSSYFDQSFLWSVDDNSTDSVTLASLCCAVQSASQRMNRANTTIHQSAYELLSYRVNHVIMPLICIFGIAGNLFSIYVFSRRWLTKYMDQLERSATAGLISLAVSDLSFCLVGLPALFLQPQGPATQSSVWDVLAMYYKTYRPPLKNLFILNSTWIIVMISVERFIAVSYAIKARWLIRVRVTIIIHITVFLASFIVCLPLMLRTRIETTHCPNNHLCYYTTTWSPLFKDAYHLFYKIIWGSVGTFVPLLILAVTSIRLLVDLYRSKAFGLADPDRYCTPQITTMIAAILLTFIVLICPSMIVEFLGWMGFSQGQGRYAREGVPRFKQAVVVTNLLQTIKFASNFLLYCAVSREFRKNFNFRRLKDSLRSNTSRKRKHVTLQRTVDGTTTSACQLIALNSTSRTPSHDGRELSFEN